MPRSAPLSARSNDRPYATAMGFYIGDRVEAHTLNEPMTRGYIVGINESGYAVVQLDHGAGTYAYTDDRLTRIED